MSNKSICVDMPQVTGVSGARRGQNEATLNQRLFTVGAAAQYLGISDDTLRKYADLGAIPAYRFINGHRAFKLEDLNRLIDELPMWNDRTNDATCAGRDKEAS